jgi:hypothetical protein
MMTLDSLKEKLEQIPYPHNVVSFNTGYHPDGYNIDCVHGIWRYYFVDECQKYSDEHRFNTEDELCCAFLKKIEEEYIAYQKYQKKWQEAARRKTNLNISDIPIIYL